MKNVSVDVIKVCAWGYAKSCVTFCLDGHEYCILIPRDLYFHLRDLGVPTSQKLRYEKHE